MESEDDDRRGRDKFARERDFGRRDDDRFGRNDHSNSGGVKRSGRRDDYGNGNGPKRGRLDSGEVDAPRSDDAVMLTFKKFLITQDDDITDEQAIAKYNEYKLDFKRQQLVRFFNAHKNEEWFRHKYHPDDSQKIRDAHLENVKKRLEIFDKLKESGAFGDLALDLDNAKGIIRILDTVVVLLEGGTEEDLEALRNEKIEDESIDELQAETDKTAAEKEKPAETDKAVEEGEEKPIVPEEEKKPAANGEDGAISDGEDAEKKKKMLLHKTCSVFLRNVPPSVTMEEIEAICKRSPGFLRVALADVIPERKFYRRGWATYKRDVNIKEICWNLNSIRIRDSDLNAIINRDLTRRVRTTNGITAHKTVAQNDLRMAAKLTAMLDKRIGLYGEDTQPLEEREKDIKMGVDLVGQSKNPLVKQAKHVLMDIDADEISPEEEELLRRSGTGIADTNGDSKNTFSREESALKALDTLVLYLRIVHSIDFYGHLDYPNEDNMPSRCGILHVRGQTPTGKQWGTGDDGKVLVSTKFVNDFTSGFNQRLESSLMNMEFVTDDDLVKLGKKDGEKEVDAFVLVNTVELAKDKWLCPLSGKKFKGPEFIKKHLQSKHEDKLNEVKHEALFFNNYLSDPKRPVDVEVKPSAPPARERDDDRRGGDDRYSSNRSADRSRPPPSRSYGYSGPPRDHGSGARGGGGGRYDDGPRGPRPQVSYRDLDAPEDIA